MKKELELYIHIPFCIKKCEYCDFLSGPGTISAQREYVDAVCREIEALDGYENYEVVSVFIGGGTPSVLPGAWIREIIGETREKFTYLPDAEITIEANPGTVTLEKLKEYRKAGINRISFGCQSADNRELKMLGRIHTWEEFLESFSLAREAGFSNINVDLMSGLPGQTVTSWEESLRKVAGLDPEHISAYSLIIEEGTPFAQKELDLPDEDEEREMYENTHQILESYGFSQYEISNYAKPGKESRHNIGYWIRREYLGIGLGSSSLIQNQRFCNTSDMKVYLKNSNLPETIRKDNEKLSRKEQIEEFMYLGLRMLKGVSAKQFAAVFGIGMMQVYGEVIDKYVKMGFLEWRGDCLRFTRAGISVSNPILAEFLL
ncbi:MAG: radical SAM family heme chaperone HemW [Ruminococcus sp.]|nr:radical SAM family heme chaperone HemW [Ruminococcus sp.]